MILQNLCTKTPDLLFRDIPWLQKLIRALWNFANKIWISRCKQINEKDKHELSSLTHQESIIIIREYLNLPRAKLSNVEKRLHLGITKQLRHAHSITLSRWIRLLSQERMRTIRDSQAKATKSRLPQITRFFYPKQR